MAILWIDSEFPAKPDRTRHADDDDGAVRELFAAILRARGALPEGPAIRYAGHFGPASKHESRAIDL
jgi:hypothetical protein